MYTLTSSFALHCSHSDQYIQRNLTEFNITEDTHGTSDFQPGASASLGKIQQKIQMNTFSIKWNACKTCMIKEKQNHGVCYKTKNIPLISLPPALILIGIILASKYDL